jgi:hypothetical protein
MKIIVIQTVQEFPDINDYRKFITFSQHSTVTQTNLIQSKLSPNIPYILFSLLTCFQKLYLLQANYNKERRNAKGIYFENKSRCPWEVKSAYERERRASYNNILTFDTVIDIINSDSSFYDIVMRILKQIVHAWCLRTVTTSWSLS